MAAIEWSNIYRATNRDNTPTPGYLFNDIVQNVSNACPSEIPALAQYLIDCVNGDHAHVKLKALFVIKTLAYRIPPFQQAFLGQPGGLESVQEACVFTGPPSPMFGDEPYRLVREAAEGAREVLETNDAFYHQEYKELSRRIVGFGNYEPPEDTKLPDGSVNVAKDVTFGDVLGTAVGGVLNGAGAIIEGVKGLFETHSRHVSGLELEGMDMDEPASVEDPYEEEAQMQMEEEDDYRPSTGEYVPPSVPVAEPGLQAASSHPQSQVESDLLDFERSNQDLIGTEAIGRDF